MQTREGVWENEKVCVNPCRRGSGLHKLSRSISLPFWRSAEQFVEFYHVVQTEHNDLQVFGDFVWCLCEQTSKVPHPIDLGRKRCHINPFTPKFKKYVLPTFGGEICEVVRICSIFIFHVSKLWKAKFFILCGVIFLVRLQGNLKLISLRSIITRLELSCSSSTRVKFNSWMKCVTAVLALMGHESIAHSVLLLVLITHVFPCFLG